jgi:hypothetical protein
MLLSLLACAYALARPTSSAQLIKRRGDKVAASAEKLRETLEREVAALQDHARGLRAEA